MRLLITLVMLLALSAISYPASAGLDLDNQTQIYIPDLDLDSDGRIQREELGEYMFFYFDYDGNESLTKGEYHRERELEILPYEAEVITFIDLDNDGKNDPEAYTTQSFLDLVMIDKDAAQEGEIKALRFMDEWFLRLDINKNGAIDLEEWQPEYAKHGVIKPKKRPKAANNNRYN